MHIAAAATCPSPGYLFLDLGLGVLGLVLGAVESGAAHGGVGGRDCGGVDSFGVANFLWGAEFRQDFETEDNQDASSLQVLGLVRRHADDGAPLEEAIVYKV